MDFDNKNEYKVKNNLIDKKTKNLIPISITEEMRKSFLEYSMSVIVSRALPDARDGLKPVQRRILYAMHELNLYFANKHVKSARILGEVTGKYHPHGETAVYESMVRMAQDFSMRYPLVNGQGNFGSVDGDPAASTRYTEAKMSKLAGYMVESINKETVNFISNYDNTQKEPEVLPSKIPNLLISGSTGIAVGMATNIPPHNLKEVIDGIIALIKNPEITILELMKYIKGPDFPTGGIILGKEGITQAYTTGKGSIKVKSKVKIETLPNKKSRIIVEEIPFLINKAEMVSKIASLVKNKIIEGITDLRDETARKGIRVVIEIKRDINPEIILNKLFKHSQLKSNFSVNVLALVQNVPKVLNLKNILNIYLNHQIEIVKRRTEFDLKKAGTKYHILEGTKIAILNIDSIITIIKKSKTDEEAYKTIIKEFNLSFEQAQHIINMRLKVLTNLAITKMEKDMSILKEEIKEYQKILNNHDVLLEIITKELKYIKDKYGDKRRTQILKYDEEDISEEDLIPKTKIIITMSKNGYVKRLETENYTKQNRGGLGSKSMSTYEDDYVSEIISTNSHSDLLIFSNLGRAYKIKAYKIPQYSKQAKGTPFVNILALKKDEKIISILPIDFKDKKVYLITITKKGIIKKTKIAEYIKINKNGKKALGLKKDDVLVKASIVKKDDEIIIGSHLGKVIKFNINSIRSTNRTSTGVKAITLTNKKEDHDFVIGASIIKDQQFLLSIGNKGFGKKTKIINYRKTNRGGKGVKTLNILKAGKLNFIKSINGDEDILIITKTGKTIRINLKKLATSGRSTKGVKIIKLEKNNTIKSATIIQKEIL